MATLRTAQCPICAWWSALPLRRALPEHAKHGVWREGAEAAPHKHHCLWRAQVPVLRAENHYTILFNKDKTKQIPLFDPNERLGRQLARRRPARRLRAGITLPLSGKRLNGMSAEPFFSSIPSQFLLVVGWCTLWQNKQKCLEKKLCEMDLFFEYQAAPPAITNSGPASKASVPVILMQSASCSKAALNWLNRLHTDWLCWSFWQVTHVRWFLKYEIYKLSLFLLNVQQLLTFFWNVMHFDFLILKDFVYVYHTGTKGES